MMDAAASVAHPALSSQLLLPGPVPLGLELELPGVDAQRRPPPPPAPNAQLGEHVWNGSEWIWIELLDPRQLKLTGVLPGAKARRDSAKGEHVPWALLDKRLAGFRHRRGRDDAWAEGKSGRQLLEDLRAQCMSASDLGRVGDLREPEWLRDPAWGLNKTERRVVVFLLPYYQRGWGGAFDCQSTWAAELGMTDRNLRNVLHGTTWYRCRHKREECTCPDETNKGYRPGLVERGLMTALETWRPPSAEGRRADTGWLLMRIAGALERCAMRDAFSRSWCPRPPRRSGLTRRKARREVTAMRKAARVSRYQAAGDAWRRRRAWQPADVGYVRSTTSRSEGCTRFLEGVAHESDDAGQPALEGLEQGERELEAVLAAEEAPGDQLRDGEPLLGGEGVDPGRADRGPDGLHADSLHAPEATPGAPAEPPAAASSSRPGCVVAGERASVEPPAAACRARAVRTSESLSYKPGGRVSSTSSTLRAPLVSRRGLAPAPAKAGSPPSRNEQRPAGAAGGSTDARSPATTQPGRELEAAAGGSADAPGKCMTRAERGPPDCRHRVRRDGTCSSCGATPSVLELYGGALDFGERGEPSGVPPRRLGVPPPASSSPCARGAPAQPPEREGDEREQ